MKNALARKVSVDCDLTETTLGGAITDLKGESLKMLIVGPQDSFAAFRLADKIGIPDVVVIPFLLDQWCLVGEFSSIYSNGA